MTLAEAKAQNIAQNRRKGLVIGSDCVGDCAGEIIGKPRDKAHQRQMLEKFQATPTDWYTGVCIIDASTGRKIIRADKSTLYMPRLDPVHLEHYINTVDSSGKAGGFGIQEEDGFFVEKIEGSFTNIMGFPICLVAGMLQEFGLQIPVNVHQVAMEHIGREC